MYDKIALLKNILKLLSKEFGYNVIIGSEIEFYAVTNNMQAMIAQINVIAEDFLYDLQEENGENQLEAVFLHSDDVIRHAEQLDKFRERLSQDLNINFLAKPYHDQPGSGMHFHININDNNGNNLFAKAAGEAQDSELLIYAVGGLCDLMNESMIFFAPNENDYLRYSSDRNAPCKICFGNNNRTAAIRIPDGLNVNRRIEHRICSSNADIYMSISMILIAIYHGIINKITPPNKIFGNAWDEQYNYTKLSNNLLNSKKAFDNSKYMRYYINKFISL